MKYTYPVSETDPLFFRHPPCPTGKWGIDMPAAAADHLPAVTTHPPNCQLPTRYTARTQRTQLPIANTPELLKYLLNITRPRARSA